VNKKVIAIVGTYRRGHIIDSAVDTLLDAASTGGAQTEKVLLLDKNIEFCKNCRCCTQQAGNQRGECVQDDDMQQILDKIDTADTVVLACPVNFFSVTAIMKRFIERLLVYIYWPWGKAIPKIRQKQKNKKAVLVTASGCPEYLGRFLFPAVFKVLKGAADCLGARVVKKIYIGAIAMEQNQSLPDKYKKQLTNAGKILSS